jgi:NCAIR mutase (PurE)-related protein
MENTSGLVRRGMVWFDTKRMRRTGIPEAVYAPGKTDSALVEAVQASLESENPTVVTRVAPNRIPALEGLADFDQFPPSSVEPPYLTLVANPLPSRDMALVAVLSAGASDLCVAEEARGLLFALGIPTKTVTDCGVAAPDRVKLALEQVADTRLLIVIAGFEAALATVAGALTDLPVIAVPTSVGYGSSRGGETALFSMLASCSPGLMVVGIDNGFGAAAAAARIVRLG